jgi:hypothetical protein
MTLLLKSARANRSSGSWSEDDYDVVHGGKTVGRIFHDYKRHPHVIEQWHWGIDFFCWKRHGPQYGRATSRETAMAAFRQAWDLNSSGSDPG